MKKNVLRALVALSSYNLIAADSLLTWSDAKEKQDAERAEQLLQKFFKTDKPVPLNISQMLPRELSVFYYQGVQEGSSHQSLKSGVLYARAEAYVENIVKLVQQENQKNNNFLSLENIKKFENAAVGAYISGGLLAKDIADNQQVNPLFSIPPFIESYKKIRAAENFRSLLALMASGIETSDSQEVMEQKMKNLKV